MGSFSPNEMVYGSRKIMTDMGMDQYLLIPFLEG